MTKVPTRLDLMWPTLKIVEEAGGSAMIEEILAKLEEQRFLDHLGVSSESFNILHGSGPQTEIAYQAAWARTFLKYINALENSQRGVWSITRIGRELQTENELRKLVRDELDERFKKNKKSKDLRDEETQANDDRLESREFDDEWKQNLIRTVLALDPNAFERLCQRLLREAGFVDVKVTRSSGDGGIDGTGILRVNLMTFRVGFQCKRYASTPVPPRDIREFVGAIQGRCDSGLFLTTSSFSRGAIGETKEAGRVNVDLIDGNRLCELLKEYELGMEKVERIEVDTEFFQSI